MRFYKPHILTFLLLVLAVSSVRVSAQTVTEEEPVILYSGAAKRYQIADIKVTGADLFDSKVLIGISNLTVGQRITVPGSEITDAMKRYWKNGMFSNVKILASKIVGDQIYLEIALTLNPKVRNINFHGVKKSETEDLEEKIGIIKGSQISQNMMDRAEILLRRYYDDKGFDNAVIRIEHGNNPDPEGYVDVDVYIDKKDKVKVHAIYLEGNVELSDKTILKALKNTNEKGKLREFFRTKKYVKEKYVEDKEAVISLYNEKGFRDAYITRDSVAAYGDNMVDVYLSFDEGSKYYIRNIEWIGNTVYNSEALAHILRMREGDVYNQKKLEQRISTDDDAIGNLYYDNGYLSYLLSPVEANVAGDSIDLEMRVFEGPQFTINKVNIFGNDRLYENVVRRELFTRPGDLFSKEAITRSYRQLAQMGHFNPETINPNIKPSQTGNTVDIDWELESKASDQVELSFGWGQTGLIGRMALKFTNFSVYNLFHKSDNYRMFIPQGDGQTFSISGQTNGKFYHSYSVSFLEPWLGGKRPNSLQASIFYSKQSDISSNYLNSAYYQSMQQYMYGYGYGSYGNYNSYESYYDPDKFITMLGVSLGWGKRLHWPDDYFTLYAELAYTRYKLKDWSYFLIQNGTCNNINLSLTLGRSTTDNPLFPRYGSEFSLSVSLTPPYSLFDGLDYANLGNDRNLASYQEELQKKHKWIEYHKWKFKSRTYTALTNGQKCLVLMTRADVGLLGHYNANKKSPFETFFMGGDGMSGGGYNYATETIGLRGYDNGALTPYLNEGYAYTRLTAELRYPFIMENSTTIFGLVFAEGGNAWSSINKFNPFDLKRSVGVGVRVFLPMIGLMGIDWGYGFDRAFGTPNENGSQVHFILGQEF